MKRRVSKSPLNAFILLENVLLINRTYAFCKKQIKLAILLKILIEWILIISYISTQMCGFKLKADIYSFYFLSTIINSLILLSLVIYYADEFKNLLILLQHYSSQFPDDVTYNTNIKRKRVLLLFWCSSYICLKTCLLINFLVSYFSSAVWYRFISHDLYFIVCQFHVIICDCRFMTEFYFVSCGMNVAADQIDGIMRSIDNVTESGLECRKMVCKCDSCEDNCGCQRLLIALDKWSDAYITGRKCFELGVRVFGWQVAMNLASAATLVILMLYHVTSVSVTGPQTRITIIHVVTLSEIAVAMFLMASAAQRTKYNSERLERRLGALMMQCVGHEKLYKATRDALLLVRAHPVHIKIVGFVDLGMTLLPSCVAFCTSYTVIALQLNNVI